jgi:nucleoside-diphosphate-sugar epimerase
VRVLVTGGSGYFGEIVVRRLLEQGASVRVLDLVDNADRPKDVEFFHGDIRDRELVRRATSGVQVVHHNVAQVPLAKSRREFWSVNVGGTRVALEAALAAGVRKFVLVSSSAVYGVPRRNPVLPSTRPRPREAYGRAKLVAEQMGRRFVRRGLDLAIIRPRTVLGHGRLGIFQILFEWVYRGRPVYLLGRGNNRYQFLHADDLASACLLAAAQPGSATYLVGTDRFGTMRELIEGLARHAGTKSRVRSLPFRTTALAMKMTSTLGLSPLGDYHALMYGREMFFDLGDTERALDWRPRYSNAEMIAESYDDYVAHRDEVLRRSGASAHRSAVKLGVLKLLEFLP